VLVVLSVALAMAAPAMQGWSRGSKHRDAADQLLAVMRGARGLAVSDAAVHRLNVDASAGKYWVTVQDGDQFVPLGSSFGQVYELPEGNRVELTDLAGQPINSIDFFPTGRSAVARARVICTADQRVIVLECPSPSESFRIVTNPEQSR